MRKEAIFLAELPEPLQTGDDYFVHAQMEAGGFVGTKKIVLLK